MGKTQYVVKLSDAERAALTKIVCEQRESERTIMRAKILLMSETAQQEKISLPKLAESLGTTRVTIETVRMEYAAGGIETAIYRKPRTVTENYKTYNRRIDDNVVMQIRELASSTPPDGHKRWSTRLLREVAISRGIVDKISAATVMRILTGEAPYNV